MKPFKIINKKKKLIVFNPKINFGLIGSSKNNELKNIILSQNFKCTIFNKKKFKNLNSFFKFIDILISYDNRYIFSKEDLKNFKYQILNIHGSILPKYAGRGTYSNMILLNNRSVGATLHIVTKRIDLGDIIMLSKKAKVKKKPFPFDYIKINEKLSKSLLKKFLIKIKKNFKFELFPQNQNLRFFSKKYISNINGEIDWGWTGNEIEKFIRAFSNPYKGAFTFIENSKRKIFIKKITFVKSVSHPYLIGKIFQYNAKSNTIKICVIDGFISINLEDVKINKNKNFLHKLEGKYFVKS